MGFSKHNVEKEQRTNNGNTVITKYVSIKGSTEKAEKAQTIIAAFLDSTNGIFTSKGDVVQVTQGQSFKVIGYSGTSIIDTSIGSITGTIPNLLTATVINNGGTNVQIDVSAYSGLYITSGELSIPVYVNLQDPRDASGNKDASYWDSSSYNLTRYDLKWSWKLVNDGNDGSAGRAGYDGAPVVFRGEYNKNPKTGESETVVYYGHPKRADIVYYATDASNPGKYYIARTDTSEGTSGFSNKVPTDASYWTVFGNTFDNVATSILLADEAYIDKAVVGKLWTQSDTDAHIQAMDNYIKMFDASGVLRMHISGGQINPTTPSQEYTPSNVNHTEYCDEQDEGKVVNGILTLTDFVIPANSVMSLPSIIISGSLSIPQSEEYWSMGEIYGYLKLEYYSSGIWEDLYDLATIEIYDSESGSVSDTYNGTTYNNLPAGRYRITYSYDMTLEVQQEGEEGGGVTMSASVQSYSYGNISISSDEQLVRIGSNGFSAALGNDFYMNCAIDPSTNQPTILMQGKKNNQRTGIKLSSSGLQILDGVYTYNTNVTYNSTIGGYILSLTRQS